MCSNQLAKYIQCTFDLGFVFFQILLLDRQLRKLSLGQKSAHYVLLMARLYKIHMILAVLTQQ